MRDGIPRRFSQREKIPQREFLPVWVWIFFLPFPKYKYINQEEERWDCFRIYGKEGWDQEHSQKSLDFPEVPSLDGAFVVFSREVVLAHTEIHLVGRGKGLALSLPIPKSLFSLCLLIWEFCEIPASGSNFQQLLVLIPWDDLGMEQPLDEAPKITTVLLPISPMGISLSNPDFPRAANHSRYLWELEPSHIPPLPVFPTVGIL